MKTEAMTKRKQKGQYFTVHESLQDQVFDWTKNRGETLLEPSYGRGDLIKKYLEYDPHYPMVLYEIDAALDSVVSFDACQVRHIGDFTQAVIERKFKTIIGNPPYVARKGTFNLYIQFVELCFDRLDEAGELIFIVPSDFIKLTSASVLISRMLKVGAFTNIWFPHDESLFMEAAVDVMVFRYELGVHLVGSKTIYNGVEKVCNERNGIMTFSDTEQLGIPISDMFNVYVGIVSGKDAVFKNDEFGNLLVLTDEGKSDNFIYSEKYADYSDEVKEYLDLHKAELMARKIKSFTETNWFEWGAARNLKAITENAGKPCIYVRNMTRNDNIAFVGQVDYFGGSLLCLVPKTEDVDLGKIVTYLNTIECRGDYTYAKRFKMGQKQMLNVLVPFSTFLI